LHCCRCRRHRCRSRPPCTLPPPERGRAALRAAYLGGPLFRTHRVAASRVAAFRACVRGTWVFRGAVVVYYRVCLDCGSCIKFVSVYRSMTYSPLHYTPPYTYSSYLIKGSFSRSSRVFKTRAKRMLTAQRI
jgi:hypothetical protein